MKTTWSYEVREAIEAACSAIRETPIGGGRTVWDLLKDERSREAVTITEMYADGAAMDELLFEAANAAADAATEYALYADAADPARAAAWAALYVADAAAAGDADAAAAAMTRVVQAARLAAQGAK